MLKVPETLQKKYSRLLINSEFAPVQYGNCRKWLRYYLDFCKKCDYAYAEPKNLGLFIGKLKEKNRVSSSRLRLKWALVPLNR